MFEDSFFVLKIDLALWILFCLHLVNKRLALREGDCDSSTLHILPALLKAKSLSLNLSANGNSKRKFLLLEVSFPSVVVDRAVTFCLLSFSLFCSACS